MTRYGIPRRRLEPRGGVHGVAGDAAGVRAIGGVHHLAAVDADAQLELAGLQAELARSIAESVTGSIADSVQRARQHQTDAREIVDRTFDAFDKEGAGALAAWMILSGNRDALNPILESIHSLVTQLSIAHEDHHVPESTLWLVLVALGDSLLGAARPRLAIVSVGARNRYGHPDPGVVARLGRFGVRILRTDENGSIVVRIGPSGDITYSSER
mgnify:CR=1 FL=1